ncbi:MAG TPA: hypothetical protein VN654_24040 [Vicinamibacterales bacterium]|nr:hypothetical protein [Vicinamibacterales bacterium]
MPHKLWGREDLNTMLEAIERQGVNLTSWEETFVDSLRVRFDAGHQLTEKQVEALERIYAERTR